MLFLIQAEDNANKGKLRAAVEDYRAAIALDRDLVAHNIHLHLGLVRSWSSLDGGRML